MISIGVPVCPGKRSACSAVAKAALLSAGNIRESPCENLIPVIGAAMIPRITTDKTTALTGRFITRRAVFAQRPSSLGVIADLRTTPLSMRSPSSAMIGGNPNNAPITASATTDTPA